MQEEVFSSFMFCNFIFRDFTPSIPPGFVIARDEAIHFAASGGFGDWISHARSLPQAWIASSLAMTNIVGEAEI